MNEDGYIEGVVNIPLAESMANLDELSAKEQPIVVICASGHRGGVVLPALKMLGHEDVKNLGGATNAWKATGLQVATHVDRTMVWAEYLAAPPVGQYATRAAASNSQDRRGRAVPAGPA